MGKIQKVLVGGAWRLANSMFPRLLRSTAGQPLTSRIGGNHRIQKFSPDGAPLGQFGTDGSGAGQIHLPTGLLSIATGICISRIRDNWRMIKLASRRNFS